MSCRRPGPIVKRIPVRSIDRCDLGRLADPLFCLDHGCDQQSNRLHGPYILLSYFIEWCSNLVVNWEDRFGYEFVS